MELKDVKKGDEFLQPIWEEKERGGNGQRRVETSVPHQMLVQLSQNWPLWKSIRNRSKKIHLTASSLWEGTGILVTVRRRQHLKRHMSSLQYGDGS